MLVRNSRWTWRFICKPHGLSWGSWTGGAASEVASSLTCPQPWCSLAVLLSPVLFHTLQELSVEPGFIQLVASEWLHLYHDGSRCQGGLFQWPPVRSPTQSFPHPLGLVSPSGGSGSKDTLPSCQISQLPCYQRFRNAECLAGVGLVAGFPSSFLPLTKFLLSFLQITAFPGPDILCS